MAKTIIFSLRPGLSRSRQRAFLDRIREWDGVSVVGKLHAGRADTVGTRMFFLYTDSDATFRRLKEDSNVENASAQPERYAAAF
jgi:hypothetical protein